MKKIFFLLIAANGALSAIAQTTEPGMQGVQPVQPARCYNSDSLLSKWAIDINLLGGALTQDYTVVNTFGNYPNALKADLGNLKFTNGMSFGLNAQIGYFFDRKGHFGVSTGFLYIMQRGDATLSSYNVVYKGTDANGDFRQIITAKGPIKEELEITNMNIPLMLKYRTRFSERWGFTADAGVLFNLKMRNRYTTNGTFDYEAIVRHVTDANGNVHTVYDNGDVASNTDLMITRDHYNHTNPGGNVNDYFNLQRSLGYNVGVDVKPNNTKGSVDYDGGSVGFMASPSVSYFLNDNVSLSLGAYYMYQSFYRSPGNGVRITDAVGSYNSPLNNVSHTVAHSYGANLGVRVLIGKLRDKDGDGVLDRDDKCPDVFGLAKFHGCPDRDNDGIPDDQDSCPDVFGIAQFKGCPDSDGDGVPDDKDACPYQPGPARFNGCPDTDGDGVPDSEDRCPTVQGPISNMGCPVPVDTSAPPVRSGRTQTYRAPERDLSEPILFDLGKTVIKDISVPILMEAVMELNNNENAFIMIDGHTDAIGSDRINDPLSYRRANAVKKYLTDMGGNPKRMMAVGHGSRQPVAPNTTAEGRAMNRRVSMQLMHRPK